jgi:hypothetical protein
MKSQTLNFLKLNIRWLAIGILLLILGYIILGWDNTNNRSYEETVFAWHKLTLAPIVILFGYAIIGLSIMHQKKS